MAAAKRWHQPLLAAAFQCWAEQAQELKQLAARLEQAVGHWLRATLASAFSIWRYQASSGQGGCEGRMLPSFRAQGICLSSPCWPVPAAGLEGQGCGEGGSVLQEPCSGKGLPGTCCCLAECTCVVTCPCFAGTPCLLPTPAVVSGCVSGCVLPAELAGTQRLQAGAGSLDGSGGGPVAQRAVCRRVYR